MHDSTHSPNLLLASLAAADFDLVHPHLRSIEMVHQTVLVRVGEKLTHVYFPHSGVISLVIRMTEGETVEAAMVGKDSVYGASAALDGRIALNDAIVQIEGACSVLDVQDLRAAADKSAAFRTTLIRHEQALFAQAIQAAGCNASHAIEARLARWLLRARDLEGSDSLGLTQEFLAQMLGVQRTSVSTVANSLQRAGLIRYSRGQVEILDPKGLEASSCECYSIVKDHYARLARSD